MLDSLNGGYIALGIVGVIFLALQAWWISMTIFNRRKKSILLDNHKSAEIKKRLEKIFLKSNGIE